MNILKWLRGNKLGRLHGPSSIDLSSVDQAVAVAAAERARIEQLLDRRPDGPSGTVMADIIGRRLPHGEHGAVD